MGQGRPSKFKAAFCQQAAKLCALGATDAELADFFGVAVSTLQLWKVEHPSFSDAVKVAKAKADERVERSLFQRASGYSHPDVHISNWRGEVTITPITKHYPPDTVACIFWLKNRQPQDWRDKIDVTNSDGSFADALAAARARVAAVEQPEPTVN